MKFISKIVASCLAAVALVACTPSGINDLTGEYGDVAQVVANKATVLETQKMGKGIKSLNVELTDGSAKSTLHFYSAEWILGVGEYKINGEIADMTAAFTAPNGQEATSGSITVNMISSPLDTVYYINALAHVGTNIYHVSYQGSLSFIVGEDDPEPSGITFKVNEIPYTYFSMATWSNVEVPGKSYYQITVTDEKAKDILYIELINPSGMAVKELVGDYTIAGADENATPMTIANGYNVPAYYMAGGAWFINEAGAKQYISSGAIKMEVVTGSEGQDLYNFSAEGLGMVSADENATESTGGAFKYRFCEVASNELPVASGYTIKYTVTNPVSVTTDGQNYTNYDNLDRIDIECKDAAGNPAGYFSLVVNHGTDITDITGSYDIVSGATEAGKCEAGVCYPGWNVMWYTYVMDQGIAKYANAGNVVVKVAKDAEGKDLYNFKYTGVSAVWSPNGTYGVDWADIAQSTDLAGEVPYAVIAQ